MQLIDTTEYYCNNYHCKEYYCNELLLHWILLHWITISLNYLTECYMHWMLHGLNVTWTELPLHWLTATPT